MFIYERRKLGRFSQVTLRVPDSENLISFIPDFGGCVTKGIVNGTSIFTEITDEKQLLESQKFENFWLLPFPNRVKSGKFSWKRQDHQLPINEHALNNAIHGFFYSFKTVNTEVIEKDRSIACKMQYAYDGSYQGLRQQRN